MANEVFIDTSGFYAILVRSDDRHLAAEKIVRDARRGKRRFITTDYVLDETATLLKARGLVHLVGSLVRLIESSGGCRIEWTDPERFQDALAFFLKHTDQAWSFTDCLSFRIMKQLRLRDALTKDEHFSQAGFVVLLK